MEQLIADALDSVGASYTTDLGGGNPSGLDFRLSSGVEIEVKRFHSDRIGEQMSRAPNVIVAQGEDAVRFLAYLIRASGAVKHDFYSFGPPIDPCAFPNLRAAADARSTFIVPPGIGEVSE